MSLFSDSPVPVPDLVGLDYEAATAAERRAGVHIADPDPDAPPISNFWWEHKELVVLAQHPAPGSRIDRKRSVTVVLGPPEAPVGAAVGSGTPPALDAHAVVTRVAAPASAGDGTEIRELEDDGQDSGPRSA